MHRFLRSSVEPAQLPRRSPIGIGGATGEVTISQPVVPDPPPTARTSVRPTTKDASTMHGDAMNMERSTLERKDRAELAAVAEALGIKVPSRAKKADIISLILDGVSGFGPAEESNDGTADAGPTGADASEDHGADDRRPEVDSAEDRSAAEAEVSTGSSTSEAESAPAEAAATATGSRARGGASSVGAGRPSIPAPPTLASNGSDSDADHESAAGEDGAGHAEDRSESGDHGDGEGEGSSRSRRRRPGPLHPCGWRRAR